MNVMELNDTDVKILKGLLEDARFSSRQIAKNVGVSVGTVLSRIKKMEDDGLIKGYSVILDHEKLGYQLTVVTEITVSKGRLVETENEIAKIPKRLWGLRRDWLNRRHHSCQIQEPRRPWRLHKKNAIAALH